MRVEDQQVRSFYEIEAVKNHWNKDQLERQINSLLFERLLKSRDKEGLLQLTKDGQHPDKPMDVIKDPYVLEFLDIPESPRLMESNLEQALIDHLQAFLLELGSGFAFVGRQKRLTLDGDHFYPDLVHSCPCTFLNAKTKGGSPNVLLVSCHSCSPTPCPSLHRTS